MAFFFWQVSFVGEGGDDYGGLFRESIRELAAELQNPHASPRALFIPSPNLRHNQGFNRECFLPNPDTTLCSAKVCVSSIYAYICMYIRTLGMHMMYRCVRMCTHVCAMRVDTYIHICVHTHIDIHTHMDIHTLAAVVRSPKSTTHALKSFCYRHALKREQ